MPAPTTATWGASSRGTGSSPSRVDTRPVPPHALHGRTLPGASGGVEGRASAAASGASSSASPRWLDGRLGRPSRASSRARLRARFCALVRDTSTPSPAQRPQHIIPRPSPPAPASAAASRPTFAPAKDDIATTRRDATRRPTNVVARATPRATNADEDDDGAHESARDPAKRRCVSTMRAPPLWRDAVLRASFFNHDTRRHIHNQKTRRNISFTREARCRRRRPARHLHRRWAPPRWAPFRSASTPPSPLDTTPCDLAVPASPPPPSSARSSAARPSSVDVPCV